MSQDFKLNFDNLPDDNSGGYVPQGGDRQGDVYDSPGHVRNICFAWPDGSMKFLNYAYLVSGEYSPDNGFVTITFTTHTVVIKGSMLAGLFADLLSHLPRVVTCTEQRYSRTIDENKPVITAIEISTAK